MRFTKMHGIGNDYVYIDCFRNPVPADPPALSRVISDRHMGIGSDGLILICPSEKADARMRMYNADGSESEMCGNGIRCVAKFVYDHDIARKPRITIETGRGLLELDLEIADGKASRIRVNMGEPILEASRIPTTFNGSRVVNLPLPEIEGEKSPSWFEEAGLEPLMTCVSMGNPHLVLYCRSTDKVPLEKVGPILENLSIFPKRINVHFVQVKQADEVIMRTWERGSGITMACGTGACAVCVAGVLTGKTSSKLLAHLPGGDLELEWQGEGKPVFMKGPAVEVFSGDWPG